MSIESVEVHHEADLERLAFQLDQLTLEQWQELVDKLDPETRTRLGQLLDNHEEIDGEA